MEFFLAGAFIAFKAASFLFWAAACIAVFGLFVAFLIWLMP